MDSPSPPASLPEGKGRPKPTNASAGKSKTSSARSIDFIVDCIHAVLSDFAVDESSHGAGVRTGATDATEDNCIHPSVKAIIDKQNIIIADLSSKVLLPLAYFCIQDKPEAVSSLRLSSEG